MMDIASDFRLVTDKFDFELQQLVDVNKKDGSTEKQWKTYGHYPGLMKALAAVPDAVSLRPEVDTIEQLIANLERIGKEAIARLAK